MVILKTFCSLPNAYTLIFDRKGRKERKEYILTNLGKASELLAEANKLTAQYEEELNSVRKEAQLEITNSQNIHKEILDIELDISQKYIDNLLDNIQKDKNVKYK